MHARSLTEPALNQAPQRLLPNSGVVAAVKQRTSATSAAAHAPNSLWPPDLELTLRIRT